MSMRTVRSYEGELGVQRPAKKSRHHRAKTGCRDCRTRRIKCPEGITLADGRKLACERCYQADVACWYPARSGEGVAGWEEAASEGSMQVTESQEVLGSGVETATGDNNPLESWEPVPGFSPLLDIASNVLIDASTDHQLPEATESVTDLEGVAQTSIAVIDSSSHHSILPSHPIELEIRRLLEGMGPSAPLSTFSLSSIVSQPVEKATMSYFESRGCNEIVAAPDARLNWIYTVLFPRLYDYLCLGPPKIGVDLAIQQYVYHSIVRLGFVHRGNMETDTTRLLHNVIEARRHQEQAALSLYRAKVLFNDESWRTEAYLMGFFTSCMADMLDSQRFVIDETVAFTAADHWTQQGDADFSASLRDMISVYSIYMTTCTPHQSSLLSTLRDGSIAPFELPDKGSEWVEKFFGASREMIRMIGVVNKLIMMRVDGIRKKKAESNYLRAEGEKILLEFGTAWTWTESKQPAGKSVRIQRGTEVIRQAVLTLVLSELLNVSLSDVRFANARAVARELVADTSLDEAAGYTWALSTIAIYATSMSERQELADTIRSAQDWSFGPGYKGGTDVLSACWHFYDTHGAYDYGIAPWREILSACGRSMYV